MAEPEVSTAGGIEGPIAVRDVIKNDTIPASLLLYDCNLPYKH